MMFCTDFLKYYILEEIQLHQEATYGGDRRRHAEKNYMYEYIAVYYIIFLLATRKTLHSKVRINLTPLAVKILFRSPHQLVCKKNG